MQIRKVAAARPLHHEDFHTLAGIAHEHDGSCQTDVLTFQRLHLISQNRCSPLATEGEIA
jgi:hypothetical protein